MIPCAPALLLALVAQQVPVNPTPGALAALLARSEGSTLEVVPSVAKEILALADVSPVLFRTLGEGRLPAADGDDEGLRLNEVQEAIVQEALRGLGRPALQGLVQDVLGRPGSVERIRASLRVQGLIGSASDLRSVERLLTSARELGVAGEVESALEETVCGVLARDEKAYDLLGATWARLEEGHASAVVRALERTRTRASLRCVQGLLGRRAEMETSLLLALGNLAEMAAGDESSALAEEVQKHLTVRDSREAQAATAALARLRAPRSVPYLIELLVSDDPVLAHAALGALRAIGGVAFPASPSAWRTWYGAEETWWQDRAPELLTTLAAPQEPALELAQLVTLLRELTEHPLHRDALAAGLACTLGHPDPAVRILGCQALQRLGSRAALLGLVPLLRDEPEVRQAAHAALVAITHVDLPPKSLAWVRALAQQGLRVQE